MEGNVYVNGKAVCHQRWDLEDARVVCRMLGMEVTRPTWGFMKKFGSPKRPEFGMINVRCKGTERDIHNCPHQKRNIHCTRYEMAGAVCKPKYGE